MSVAFNERYQRMFAEDICQAPWGEWVFFPDDLEGYWTADDLRTMADLLDRRNRKSQCNNPQVLK